MSESDERRRAERFTLSVDVRYLINGESEGCAELSDISETGLAIIGDINAEIGSEIVVYPDGLGRLVGKVVRKTADGVAVHLNLSEFQRKSIQTRISCALEGAPYLRLADDRSHVRIRYNIETTAQIEGAPESVGCTIIDMSGSGCLVSSTIKPDIGTPVTIGALRGRVCRVSDNGFAIEFFNTVEERRKKTA
jgi:hypothetical protein